MDRSGGATLNDRVRGYWEQQPCGTDPIIVGEAPRHSRAWFDRVEDFRYQAEGFIHSLAQFTRHHGKKILEVGVGAGTDHLQWARAGADCHGVDLTEAAIETTRNRLALYGFRSNLRRVDAETLPFDDDTFDVVYSWGVIHHSEKPERIIAEIHRVLKPGGQFLGMMYGRRSLCAFKLWVKHGLLAGRPWRSFGDVLWHHMESEGTKAYTVKELRQLFAAFPDFQAKPVITDDERRKFPAWLHQFFPQRWGFFITLRARKEG
jgi:ubiquinone/menaquinone biosynthesis C-methylase UbiE